jgi:hypothetical protein
MSPHKYNPQYKEHFFGLPVLMLMLITLLNE